MITSPPVTVNEYPWSGYAETGHRFSTMTGTFVIQRPDCRKSASGSWSADWVGLDGISSGSVEQAGVDTDCTHGHAGYGAWFEMYPRRSYYPGMDIQPGDSVTVTVSHNSGRNFSMRITDNTRHTERRYSTVCPKHFSCPRTSAEAVTEGEPLNEFGTARFSGVTINRSNPRWNLRMALKNADPSGLSRNERSFKITWRRA